MKKLFLLIGCVINICNFSWAQINSSVSNSYLELESFSKEQSSSFNHAANQGSLAELKNLSALIFSERRYLLEELTQYSLSIAVPSTYGNFALNTCYAGSALYNHAEVSFVYARSLGKKIDLGIQFNYNSISTQGYAGMSALTAEIGSIIHLTDKLNAGIQIENPKGGRLNKNGTEKIPSKYVFGLGYDASDKFYLGAEILKFENQPAEIEAGFRYRLLSFLSIRAGMNTSVSTLWYGIGLSWKNIKIDLLSTFHPQLGFTPAILIAFKGKGRQGE